MLTSFSKLESVNQKLEKEISLNPPQFSWAVVIFVGLVRLLVKQPELHAILSFVHTVRAFVLFL